MIVLRIPPQFRDVCPSGLCGILSLQVFPCFTLDTLIILDLCIFSYSVTACSFVSLSGTILAILLRETCNKIFVIFYHCTIC